jgi:hypothetical protein
MSFSFSFSGDDIDEDVSAQQNIAPAPAPAASTSSAFPVQGKPQLPPKHHDLAQLLAKLPSKIAYSLLDVDLDGKGSIQLPRRELWDVRVQLMAEEDADGDELEPGLGAHDVKTGIYEGGFKSWESSIDLVKVLAAKNVPGSLASAPFHIIEVSGQIGIVFVTPANGKGPLTFASPSTAGMRYCVTLSCPLPLGLAQQGGPDSQGVAGASSSPGPHTRRL